MARKSNKRRKTFEESNDVVLKIYCAHVWRRRQEYEFPKLLEEYEESDVPPRVEVCLLCHKFWITTKESQPEVLIARAYVDKRWGDHLKLKRS